MGVTNISEYINRRDVQNILSKYYPDAGPTTEQILHNINRDVKSIPDAEVVTWEQLKKAWAIATTDVAPVVHGKWIGDCKAISDADGIARCGMYGFRCSKCNGFSIEDGRYCPRCGAKMNGGADG